MDGDLQNQPEDLPRLLEAIDSGVDVASGRREVRHDSWGRTLPSRLINGMLRRFTGVAIADFGCAFNAYRRGAVEPMLGAIGAPEVHEGARPLGRRERRRGRRRPRRPPGQLPLLAAAADAARAARSRRLLAAADPVDRRRARARLQRRRDRSRDLRRRLLGRARRFPRPALRRNRHSLHPRHPGVRPRARRGVPRAHPAGGRGPAPVHRRPGDLSEDQARSGHRRGRLHLLQLRPPPAAAATPYEVVTLDALTYAGNLENLADVMSHERLSFVHGDIRDPKLVARDRRRAST